MSNTLSFTFTYYGHIKPYVRANKRFSKRGTSDYRQYQDYQESRTLIKRAAQAYMDESKTPMIPEKTPFGVQASVGLQRVYISDLDNTLKSILDSLGGVCFKDDRWCKRVTIEKFLEEVDDKWDETCVITIFVMLPDEIAYSHG